MLTAGQMSSGAALHPDSFVGHVCVCVRSFTFRRHALRLWKTGLAEGAYEWGSRTDATADLKTRDMASGGIPNHGVRVRDPRGGFDPPDRERNVL